MRMAILGGRGTLGTLVAGALRQRGHEVAALGRRDGVDALTGEGLDAALAGVDVVVDALNFQGMSATKARAFFGGTARTVAAAAARAGVKRVVVVSIAGASEPEVHRRHGYYAGKAEQEAAYVDAATAAATGRAAEGAPATIVHSTQWFELVDQMVSMIPLGPAALLPTMRMAAVSAASVAEFVAATAERDAAEDTLPPVRSVDIRGPEVATGAELARSIAAVRGTVGGRRPRVVWELPLFGKAIASGGLIPGGPRGEAVIGAAGGVEPVTIDPVTVREWAGRGERG
ncbi:epimerase [Galactobacter valiniphilus]|uniref:Epimerase n=1 Tax=Galactobacter valiniphilus TaxID=2676122 RepID=A0A399J9H7_9MICC|nr:NAD(P)H-binding protein [Galactobacter valiniphilus]RII42215.1 epimerase [Galactobacter valiniphilus]